MSDAFRDLFLPKSQAPLAGLFTKRLDLAAVLDRIAANGVSEFYNGNLTQEMTSMVRLQCYFSIIDILLECLLIFVIFNFH